MSTAEVSLTPELAVRRAANVLGTVKRYRGVTDDLLARRVGLARSRVSDYVAGQTRLAVDSMYLFAEALDVEPAVFLMSPNDALRWVLDHRPNPDDPCAPRDSNPEPAGARHLAASVIHLPEPIAA